MPLWPANVMIGLKPDAWAATGQGQVPGAGAGARRPATRQRGDQARSPAAHPVLHRKRLIGGFYAYESYTEIKRLKDACEGRTDAKGLLVCEFNSPVDGNLIVRAQARDEAGNTVVANRDIWVAGKDDWWFDVSNDDRMDVLPEKKRYEPNETAVFQVRMPFREATALVTVEREGVSESFVTRLSGKAPVVRVPLKGNYAPNVYVSVLAVRGRVGDVQPTALVDLGKPAFKLGIAEIKVGWGAHELKVEVAPDRGVYKVREQASVKVRVRDREAGRCGAASLRSRRLTRAAGADAERVVEAARRHDGAPRYRGRDLDRADAGRRRATTDARPCRTEAAAAARRRASCSIRCCCGAVGEARHQRRGDGAGAAQ